MLTAVIETLTVVGLSLNILGTFLAGLAMRKDWAQWGAGRRFLPAVLRQGRRRAGVRSVGGVGHVSLGFSASGAGRVIPAQDANVERMLDWIRSELDDLHAQVAHERRERMDQGKEALARLATVEATTVHLGTDLRAVASDVAVGTETPSDRFGAYRPGDDSLWHRSGAGLLALATETLDELGLQDTHVSGASVR